MKMGGQFKWKTGGQLQYYFAPSDNNSYPSHYTKRYKIFCIENSLLSNGSIDIGLLSDPQSIRFKLVDRILKFTVFYFNANYKGSLSGAVLVENALFFNFESLNVNIDLLWKKDFDIEHINYVLNIFINKVTQEYNAGN